MRLVHALLRLAAARWVSAGRTDPYPEWAAEIAELRAESRPASGLRALGFAASLAATRPPAGAASAPPVRSTASAAVALLLAVPMAGDLIYRGAGFSLHHALLGDARPSASWYLTAGLVAAVLTTALFAIAGQVLGSRLPLCASAMPRYRLVVTAVGGAALLGAGVLFEQTLATIDFLSPALDRGVLPSLTGTAVAATLWAVLIGLLVVAVRHRARVPVTAGLWAGLGGLLAIEVAVTAAALPRMLGVPGAARLLPLWAPAAVLDDMLDGTDTVPIGSDHVAGMLHYSAAPLAGALLTSTAFGIAYLVASARPRPVALPAAPAAVTRTRTAAGWWFALLGGLGWVAAAAWLPPVWRQLSHRRWDADNTTVLFYAQLQIRQVAILVCCCGLVLGLRRVGPAWPVMFTPPALYIVDVMLSRARLAAPAATAVGLAALLIPAVTVVVCRRLRRPGRQYGRATLPAIAIIAGYCISAPDTLVDIDTPLPILSPYPLAVTICCAALATLNGYCVCRARAEAGRPPAWWLWVMLLGVLPGVLTVDTAQTAATGSGFLGSWLETLAYLGINVLTLGLLPMPWRGIRRWVGLTAVTVALVLAVPVTVFGGWTLSAMLDAPASLSWTNIGDAIPTFPGYIAVGAAIVVGYRIVTILGRPPAATPSVPTPSPDDPVPAVPQAR